MAKAQSTASFKVTSNAAIYLKAGSAEASKIRGLQSIALPLGFETETLTVSEMGVRIDIKIPVGGSYTTLSTDYNWAPGDTTQMYLQNASRNATAIKDMRFYIDDNLKCGGFVALDLISDPNGAYRIGSFGNPSGDKNALLSGSLDVEPGGPSIFYCAHAWGTDLSFTAGEEAVAATIAATTQDFIAQGFEANDTILIDFAPGVLTPLSCKVASVTDKLLTLEVGVGDNAKVPVGAGAANTSIHGATPVSMEDDDDLCA